MATAARDEAGNVAEFLSGVVQAFERLSVTGEVIFVDDGSVDGTAERVQQFAQAHSSLPLQLIRREKSLGIAAAIEACARMARGRFLCLLPADLESSPQHDIPILYREMEEGVDVIAGYRKDRGDGKILASKLYNLLNRCLFDIRLRDGNWIKLVRTNKIQTLHLRPGWHRFLIPILVHQGCRVREVETHWHRRTYGRTKFDGWRILPAALDLVAVKLALVLDGKPFSFLTRLRSRRDGKGV